MTALTRLWQWATENFELSVEMRGNVLSTILALLLIIIIHRVLLRFALRRLDRQEMRYRVRKGITYTAVFCAVFIIGRIWIVSFDSFATFLGLLSAGVAIALKDPVANFAGWAFILVRRPIAVGDRIQVGEHTGDVIDLGLFQFTLLEVGKWVGADQPTGRLVHIPNGRIFTEPQLNYHLGVPFIWDELPLVVTFESDWKMAKEILLAECRKNTVVESTRARRLAEEGSRGFMMLPTDTQPAVYCAPCREGIQLTARYVCDPRQRRGQKEKIWEAALEEFIAEPAIDFAYETWRTVDYTRERARPPSTAPVSDEQPTA